MSHPNETIENKVKSYIISVNGEGLTADILIKHSIDLPKLDAVIAIIKQQCTINDIKIKENSI